MLTAVKIQKILSLPSILRSSNEPPLFTLRQSAFIRDARLKAQLIS